MCYIDTGKKGEEQRKYKQRGMQNNGRVNVRINLHNDARQGRVQLQYSALYRAVLRVTVTQAGLQCTDKDDDGAVITAAFIACIHSGIAAVKACILSRSDVRTPDTLVLLETSSRLLCVTTQDNDIYRSRLIASPPCRISSQVIVCIW